MSSEHRHFERGQDVIAAVNLFNDGSLPGRFPNELLVRRGEAGKVVRATPHGAARQLAYEVAFGANCVLRCLPFQLMPWQPIGELI